VPLINYVALGMSETANTAEHRMPTDASSEREGIKIIPRYDDKISHPNCLVVSPYRDAANGTAVMATVDHYLENKDAGGFPWQIVPVIERSLRLKAAVDAAVRYAKDNNVPVILLDQGGFSTTAERRQTDTTLLKI